MFSGPLGTSVSAAPAPVVGAQLGMKLAPHLSLVGNLATASSDVKAGIAFLGGLTVGHANVVMYDAGLQLDVPATTMGGTAVSPFLQAGIGGMRYTVTESLLTLHASNFAGNVGAGADVAVGRGVGIRVMAKDYTGKFDFKDATMLDVPANTTNNIALSAGLRLSF
jgi:hypothetical protein